MKLFKKALLATAVFGAMGANAAVLSSDAVELSKEGVAAGLFADDVVFEIDFVVKKLTPSASSITLTFDDNVDLTELETATQGATVDVDNTVGSGVGEVKATAVNTATVPAAVGDTLITFSYGTGSFTFDRFIVDADAGTITFDVNLGNPLTAESAFRMSVANISGVDFNGAAEVCYSSEESDGTSIETGECGVLAKEVSQFSFGISKEFDGRIERVSQDTFSRNGDDAADATVDELAFTFTNNQNLGASLTVTDFEVELEGNFDNETATDIADGNFAEAGAVVGATLGLSATLDALTYTEGAAPANTDGTDNDYLITFTGDDATGLVIPQTGSIAATATVSANAGAAAVTPFAIVSNAEAGSWALDATVINIPYFPVGFEGLSTSVHFANESANDADVIVTAIDQAGNKYDGTLADLAGDTVTKVSQVTIMDVLGAPAGSKLSVTFNIDANDGDVNAYAFSNAGTGRQALVTSQEKGIK